MILEFPTYSVIFILSSLLTLGLALAAYRRRSLSGSGPFSLLMLSVSVWLIGRAFEGATLGIPAKIFWAKIEYLGIPWVGVLWLFFILRFTGRDKILSRSNIILAALIPAATAGLAFTNEVHHLIWTSIEPSPAGGGILIYAHGLWFWIAAVYNYLGIITGTILMLLSLRSEPRYLRRQSAVLVTGLLIPIAGNLAYLAGLSPVPGLDITPFGFVVSGLIFTWIVFGMNLFQLVPVAREHLVDNLSDGILVLDPDNLVADINPAALRMLKIDHPASGKNISELTPLLSGLKDLQKGSLEIQASAEPISYLELKVNPLTQNELTIGRLVVIHDITGQKLAEAEQVKGRKRAEALNEITHSVYHKLEINELMELVYQQINRFMDARFFLIANYFQESDEWESIFLREPGNEFPRRRYKSGEGITGYVIQTQEPLLLNNSAEIDSFLEQTGRYNVALKPKSMMVVPLIGTNGVVGAMGTNNYDQENYYSRDDFFFFSTVGLQIAAAFENAASYARMEQLAITDALTGLYNRRYLFSLAQVECDQASRYNRPLSAIMMDIDHFKDVNDVHGHAAGDLVLQNVAEMCRKTFRKVDTVGRYGGEEFLIILPETNASQSVIAAERLRSRIAQADVEAQEAHIQITVSMGVASLDTADSLECLVEQADKAMYAAKQAGRNQTKIFSGR